VTDAQQKPRVQVDEAARHRKRIDRAVVDDAKSILEGLRGIEARDDPLTDVVHVDDDSRIAHDLERARRLDREAIAEPSLLGDRVTESLADERDERSGDTREPPVQEAPAPRSFRIRAASLAEYVRMKSAPALRIAVRISIVTREPSSQPRSSAAFTIAYSPLTLYAASGTPGNRSRARRMTSR